MAKRMSKTLASELADRTLEVVNPQNRAMALGAALRRHGFDTAAGTQPAHPVDREVLLDWLLTTYAPK